MKKTKKKRTTAPKAHTVGVRFPGHYKLYTYRIPRHFQPYRGQMLMVVHDGVPKIVFVVEIDPPIPRGYTLAVLTPVTGHVVEF